MSDGGRLGCVRLEEVRDYAFDELDAAARGQIETHLSACGECAAELDRLQLTTAALRILPDREIPQRIAFVSDKVFAPSPAARWFAGFWNSTARLGFAAACILSVGLIVAAYRPGQSGPAQVASVTSSVTANASVSKEVATQVDAAVARAVDQAVSRVRSEDARILESALAVSDQKHEREHHALLAAMDENLTVLQKRYSTATMLAANDVERFGVRQ